MVKEKEKPCTAIGAGGHKGSFAWVCWILNNLQQKNREKTTAFCPPYSPSLPRCSSTHRMPPGDSFCSMILVYCPLPALFPSAWGEFLYCCCSSTAACQLPEAVPFPVTTLCWLHRLCLAKLNQLVKTRHANLSSIPGNRSFPFFFCEQICWLKNIKIKRWPSLQLRNIAKTPLMLWPGNDFQVTDLYLRTKQLIICYT